MAKAQTTQSANLANQTASSVPGAVAPTITNANQQQQGYQQGAQQTLGTQQSQVAPAQSTYENMAQTGGFSPTDETTYLNRATQGVAGTYDVLGQQAARQREAAGGLGTGGEISQMARQGTQAQAQATENAQADLKQQENANKLAGAAGLSGLAGEENQLYNTQTGQATAQGQQVLQALGLQYSTQEQSAQVLAQLSKNPGLLQNILSVAGIAGGAASGLGALGWSPLSGSGSGGSMSGSDSYY